MSLARLPTELASYGYDGSGGRGAFSQFTPGRSEEQQAQASDRPPLGFRQQLPALVFLVTVPQGGQQLVPSQGGTSNYLIHQEVQAAQALVQSVRLGILQLKLRLEDGLEFLTPRHRRPP